MNDCSNVWIKERIAVDHEMARVFRLDWWGETANNEIEERMTMEIQSEGKNIVQIKVHGVD